MSILGYVNVKDFGATGNGTADDTSAIQAAINTGNSVYFPKGNYKTTGLVTFRDAQRFLGEAEFDTLLSTPSGSSNDILRVAHSRIKVEGLLFRPTTVNNVCIRVYAAYFNLSRCRMLAAGSGSGTAIVFQDRNPSNVNTPGSYIHTIENCALGYYGYAFSRVIDCDAPTNGIQACKFLNNIVWGDQFINLPYGGGNTYFGNLFQSNTGSYTTQAGDCISLGATATGEMIVGNYFERYANAVKSTRSNNSYRIVNATANQYDNCAHSVTVASGITNFINDEVAQSTSALTLTTNNTTGPATLVGSVLNVPQYSSSPAPTYSLLTGTVTGDMADGGGLSAINDGVTSKTYAACARKSSGNSGYIQFDFGSSKTVAKIDIYPSSDYGFDTTTSMVNQTLVVKTSPDGSTWTTRGTISNFPDVTAKKTFDASNLIGATGRYLKIELSNSNAGPDYPLLAQVQPYEAV